MKQRPLKVVTTPHARAWGGVIFGAFFVAAYLALAEEHPPRPRLDDPLGAAFCLVSLALAIRSLRLAVVIEPDFLVIRGYLTTRRIGLGEVDSLSVIDYPGPWWLNNDRFKGLRVNRIEGRWLTVWGLTGHESRIRRARAQIEAELQALASGSRCGDRSQAPTPGERPQ